MADQFRKVVLRDVSNGIQPFLGHTERMEILGLERREDRMFNLSLDDSRNLLYRFQEFHDLHGAGMRVDVDSPPLRPSVRLIVAIHITESESVRASVGDNPDVCR